MLFIQEERGGVDLRPWQSFLFSAKGIKLEMRCSHGRGSCKMTPLFSEEPPPPTGPLLLRLPVGVAPAGVWDWHSDTARNAAAGGSA